MFEPICDAGPSIVWWWVEDPSKRLLVRTSDLLVPGLDLGKSNPIQEGLVEGERVFVSQRSL
jgi:hypothetical protein